MSRNQKTIFGHSARSFCYMDRAGVVQVKQIPVLVVFHPKHKRPVLKTVGGVA